jgi:glutathione synthase
MTVTSNDFDETYGVIEADPSEKWVLKPTNEGCGADVFFVSKQDINAKALLQSCTGNEVPKYEMYGRHTVGLPRKYVAMQSYVDNVDKNEKRVLLSGGEPVCGFRRFIDPIDQRGNVTLGTKFEGLDLTEDEDEFCRALGQKLMSKGVYFVGIDLAYPYVFELNIANPGALNYSFRATGIDQSEEAMQFLIDALVNNGILTSTEGNEA